MSANTEPKVGDRVHRIDARPEYRAVGTVIEVDETRIRVQWDGSLRRYLRRDTEGKSWRLAPAEAS